VDRRGRRRTHPQTRFVTVRFGNVLASSGSVVPIFRARSSAAAGDRHRPEMTRYFMTIPEAVQLVIRSGRSGGRERRGLRARDG
jgi:FlaA1/EpsC-like NDP-sugar epimerase